MTALVPVHATGHRDRLNALAAAFLAAFLAAAFLAVQITTP